MPVSSEKNKKKLTFLIYEMLNSNFFSKNKKQLTEPFQIKNTNFWNHFLKLF